MALKVFQIEHHKNDEWLFEGLVKTLGEKQYSSFSCHVSVIQEHSKTYIKELEMMLLDGEQVYKIVPTLGGTKYLSHRREKALTVNLNELKLPENVWMGVVGSIVTPL